MGLYDYISGIAVLIYVFLLFIMLNAQKTRIRNIFLGITIISIMWAGGSWLMRVQAPPSYGFWFHVSLMGMLFLPVSYFRFINEFIHKKSGWYMYVYETLLTIIFITNIVTGLAVPPPVISLINGQEVFVYEEFGFLVYGIILLTGTILVHMLIVFYTSLQRNPKLKRISAPITLGLLSIFLGNVLVVTPLFEGFPIDILAGILNAVFLVYALARRSPFQLKMLMSENVGYVVAFFLSILSLIILNPFFTNYLNNVNATTQTFVVAYLALFMIFIVTYYVAWRIIIIESFVKDVEEKEILLSEFSSTITRSLETKNIFKETIQVIEQIVGVHNVYIAVKGLRASYKLEYSNQPLADLSISFRKDNPIMKRLQKQNYLNIEDFKFDNRYQTMWEKEKFDLVSLDVTHIFGLYSESEVLGTMFISDSHSKKPLSQHDIIKIQQICSMLSIALKNSASYEKAIIESRTDDLTGLFNRKYFYQLMDEQFELNTDNTLGLVLMNLDDFKLYNQLYGAKNADDALRTIATIVKGSVGSEGYVCRFSGKEFIMILPNFDVFRTLELMSKIRKQISLYAEGNQKVLEKNITTSVGVCVYPFGASNKDELISNVQQAVYQVKRTGKNAVKVFDTFIKKEEVEKRSLDLYFDEYKSTIFALTAAIDAKDHYTFSHSDNVASYGVAFATELGLNTDIIENVRQAALLHDIGKISIPEHILNKPGRLDEEEYRVMQGHVDASIDIIRHLPSLDYVIPGVLGHHERYDGKGYPRRIKGENIPLTARILCIVDSFEAMTAERVYKKPREVENALQIITEEAGKQFDPNLALEFVGLVRSGKIPVMPVNSITNGNEEEHFKADTIAVN